MDEHKPCPFCGDEPMMEGTGENWETFVWCPNCYAQGPALYIEDEELSRDERLARAWELWDGREWE